MMILRFTNFQLGNLYMKVPDEKVMEQVQALITLGYEPIVEMSDTVDV